MEHLRIRIVVSAAVVLCGWGAVHAETRTRALDALVDTQIGAYFKGDQKAFRAALAKDGQCSFLGLNPRSVVIPSPPENVEDLKVVRRQTGWSGTWGWSAAELTFTSSWRSPSVPKESTRETETWHWVTFAVVERGAVKARLVVADHRRPRSPHSSRTPPR